MQAKAKQRVIAQLKCPCECVGHIFQCCYYAFHVVNIEKFKAKILSLVLLSEPEFAEFWEFTEFAK
jgi:hypothetical protein